jgi:beta-N-acetylhexosaminidase
MKTIKNKFFYFSKDLIILVSIMTLLCVMLSGCGPEELPASTAGPSSQTPYIATLIPTDEATSVIVNTEVPSVTQKPTESLMPTPVVSSTPKPITTEAPTHTPTHKPITAEEILDSMTLEQKIYQMFIVTTSDISATGWDVTAYSEDDLENLKNYPVGGIIYFEGSIIFPEQTKQMLKTVREYSEKNCPLPLFACVDEEGGRVAKVANNDAFGVTKFGGMDRVETEEQAYNIGKTIGSYLSELGFDMDFAPVADVLTEEENTVIGNRSFGTDPYEVTAFASAVSKGIEQRGVLSTFKHFPGHGATTADSHLDFAVTQKTYEEMLVCDLIPFAAAGKNGVSAIMTAHISAPNIIGDNTPCSLSHKMITEILKGELGYDGLVITDALNMGAISKNYTPEEAAIMAVKAGNDMLLMPDDFHRAASGLIEAVRNGEISEERIDKSVLRIIETKITR